MRMRNFVTRSAFSGITMQVTGLVIGQTKDASLMLSRRLMKLFVIATT